VELVGVQAAIMYGMELRPLTAADAPELRRIRRIPAIVDRWDELEPDFPMDDEPGSARFTIVVDGAVAGMIQYYEGTEPKYRHAGIDLFIDPALHNRGIGTAAVREVVRILVEKRGHHRIVIDPAADNAAAIRAYEKAGFVRVGITRKSERDADGQGWHDGLMMELVV
jgi:aminoglycoside 6'-N-acetyltransferase